MTKEKSHEFYKQFYDEHGVDILQYKNLRKCFNKMVTKVLGKDYYNMAMDVYDADRICCEDVASKAKQKGLFRWLFN